MPPLPVRQGLDLFDRALGSDHPVLGLARLNLAVLRARPGIAPVWRSLAGGVPRRAAGNLAEEPGGLAGRLAGVPAPGREQILAGLVRESAAAVLGYASSAEISTDQPFSDLGFDSLTSVELRNLLQAKTGVSMPATLAFDYPTVAHVAGYLAGEFGGPQPAQRAVVPGLVPVADDPIVLVGMACRYPGGVAGPEDLWRLVADGADGITAFPADRGWDLDALLGADGPGSGTSATGVGGFVEGAGEFDAAFFRISPREALATDPQQRLLLEVSWEALEQAGIDPGSLAGSPTGVFAGAYQSGYAELVIQGGDQLLGHQITGSAGSVISGRVAYALGLEGPAVSVDTACSSSLVAMHLAAQALRAGECTLALAGGVTVMAAPDMFIGFTVQGGLAADGRCKSFADTADGTGWGEGVGVVVMERLSDARRNGHQVLAVLRSSAVNQDGASNGLTAPNGPSQQRVIRQALATAGLSASDVDAVEAHGTGTTLGDPIEAQALLATYGQDRAEERPLWLGSLKSNIGHTQAAAGVGGVIKMVMAMRHGVLPKTLHVDEPTSQVDWAQGEVRLLTEAIPWPETGRPRRAGVSSFGVSGTNAHCILEQGILEHDVLEQGVVEQGSTEHGSSEEGVTEQGTKERSFLVAASGSEASPGAGAAAVPDADGQGDPQRRQGAGLCVAGAGGVVPWVVSGKSAEAVRGQAARLAEFAEADPGLDPVDVGWSLASSRAVFDHRIVVTGAGREELVAGLRAAAAGQPGPDAADNSKERQQRRTPPRGRRAEMPDNSKRQPGGTGTAGPGPADAAASAGAAGTAASAGVAAGVTAGVAGGGGRVVFVFPGQGAQWEGMARDLLDSCPVFAESMDRCAAALAPFTGWRLAEVLGDGEALGRAEVVQPVLWAVMVSLAAVWRSAGVGPDAVVGHSQGEIAAACVAGGLSLADGARIVALRARAVGEVLAGTGAMAAVPVSAEQAQELVAGRAGLSVAAVNGPASVVIAGDPGAVDDLVASCGRDGIRARKIAVDYASHSPHVEQIRGRLLADLEPVRPGPSAVPVYSSVTGELADTGSWDGEYWYSNLRSTVQFGRALDAALDSDSDSGGGGGVTVIEVSPHPVLLPAVQDTIDQRGDGAVAAVGTLRRDDGSLARVITSAAHAWACGVHVDWAAVFAGSSARRVPLPTYAFQRQRFWPDAGGGVVDVAGAGLAAAGHPLLGAVLPLPGSGGVVFTSRLSLRTHPWLAGHAVRGTVVFPGTGYVELAIRAGDSAGCDRLDELVLEAPLVLPAKGGVQLQVVIGDIPGGDQAAGHADLPGDTGSSRGAGSSSVAGSPGDTGSAGSPAQSGDGAGDGAGAGAGVLAGRGPRRRSVEVYARADGQEDWTRHAAGVLSAAPPGQSGDGRSGDGAAGDGRSGDGRSGDGRSGWLAGGVFGLVGGAWPPPGAAEVDVAGFYDELAGAGFLAYGPVFRGLARAWEHGDGVILAEVELPGPGRGQAGSFGIHPALLDAALHGSVLAGLESAGTGWLPFSFTDVMLHASGASALRVALTRTGPDQVAVAAADSTGAPVLSAGSLRVRPASAAALAGSPGDGTGDGAVLTVQWIEAAAGAGASPVPVREWVTAARPGRPGRLGAGFAGLAAAGPASSGAGYAGLAEVGAALDGGAAVPQAVLLAVSGDPDRARSGDPDPVVASVHELAGWVLGELQYWLAADRYAGIPLVVVTAGAAAAEPGDPVADLAAAAVRGLVRSAQAENPGRIILLDLDPAASTGSSPGTDPDPDMDMDLGPGTPAGKTTAAGAGTAAGTGASAGTEAAIAAGTAAGAGAFAGADAGPAAGTRGGTDTDIDIDTGTGTRTGTGTPGGDGKDAAIAAGTAAGTGASAAGAAIAAGAAADGAAATALAAGAGTFPGTDADPAAGTRSGARHRRRHRYGRRQRRCYRRSSRRRHRYRRLRRCGCGWWRGGRGGAGAGAGVG